MTNSHANLDRILLPLDGSEAAASIVPYIERFATMIGAEVTLLGVAHSPPEDLPIDPSGGTDIGVITQYLEGMKRRLIENGISADVDVQEGEASKVIEACASGRRCGIIALSTRGRSATGPNLLGITTDMLIRSSSVPIIVIPPDGNGGSVSPVGGVKTIIVGLDGSETAASSLGLARQLARDFGLQMALVRATPPVDSLDGAATYFGSVSDHAEQYVKRVADQLAGDGITVRTVVGPLTAHEQLLQVAEESDEPLLILSTRGWSNRADWQLGSVTDRVVRTARFPVLVIPPGGRA